MTINRFDDRVRISFSLTGTLIDYCERYDPSVLDSFEDLFNTGCVDLIEETYYHSSSSLFNDLDEFVEQVKMHRSMIKRIFDYEPKVFRNTEAIYDNRIAKKIEESLTFPGQIRVTVIRETRAVEYANK